MDYVCKKAVYQESLLPEREAYYEKMGQKGLTLIGIDNKKEIYKKEISNFKYKIVYCDVEAELEEAKGNDLSLLWSNDKQAIYIYEQNATISVPNKVLRHGNRRAFWYFIGQILSVLISLIGLLFFNNHFLDIYVIGYFFVAVLFFLFLGIKLISLLVYVLARIMKKLLPKALVNLNRMLYLFISALLVFVFSYSFIAAATAKYYSFDYLPDFVLQTEALVQAEVTHTYSDEYKWKNKVFTYKTSLWDNYKIHEDAGIDGDININLDQSIYVFHSFKEAKMVFDMDIWLQNNGLYSWMSKDKLTDITDTSTNKGFDKIYYSDRGLYNYYILKDNVILQLEVNSYSMDSEERAVLEDTALTLIANKLEIGDI